MNPFEQNPESGSTCKKRSPDVYECLLLIYRNEHLEQNQESGSKCKKSPYVDDVVKMIG